ncbi:MAG: non-heme iron oxygenase ferredoxin subunit [Armatimonadetes bacterium]|nr:non-heme iron oxygenase ferredoxin subunit [Armatimonadota bacterium]
MLKVYLGHRAVAIYNVDGELFATTDNCTHETASLSEGTLNGHEVTCPKHNARFDVRTGKALCFPAVVGLKRYSVRVEDDDVFIGPPA